MYINFPRYNLIKSATLLVFATSNINFQLQYLCESEHEWLRGLTLDFR